MEPSKSWWKYGIVAYLLALPILLWRSSKVGRTISIISLVAIGLWILRALASYGLHLYAQVFVLNHLATIKTDVIAIETTLTRIHHQVEGADTESVQIVAEALERIEHTYHDRRASVEQTLQDIEESTTNLQLEERQRIKQRIIAIREQVKLLGKSLDSVEIRGQVEEIIPGLKLLKDDERQRFLNDLSAINMALDGVKSDTNTVWSTTQQYLNERYIDTSGSAITSGTVVFFETD